MTSRRAQRRERLFAHEDGTIARVTGLGHEEEALRFHHRAWPEFTGEHLWCLFGMWRLTDPARFQTEAVHLDIENLISFEGPGCVHCEVPWKPELTGTPCPGGPT